jgi:hypothetical protein
VTTPGVLFDWALPLLTPGDGKARAKDVGVRFAALSALRECLAVADDVTLARYATAVCNAVQRLLEDEQTQMQLLTPLLGVVAQVWATARKHAVPAVVHGIVQSDVAALRVHEQDMVSL